MSCDTREALDLSGYFIPVDPHIAYGNSLPQERIPSNAPGTFSTHKIPGKVNRVAIYQKVINFIMNTFFDSELIRKIK